MWPEALGSIPKRSLAFLRPLLLLALLGPLIYTVYRQWVDVRITLAATKWSEILKGLMLLMLAQPLMGCISWSILKSLGQHHPYPKITAIYFISQATKYLPGGIWAFPSRVVAYQTVGVEKTASLISLVEEVGALFFGAAAIGLAGLVLGLPVPVWVRTTIAAGLGACLLAILVFQASPTWRLAARLRLIGTQTLAAFEDHRTHLEGRWLLPAVLGSLAFWIITGSGFHLLASGISPQASQLSVLQSSGIFGLAWCAGFVIVVAPAGIGVREAALSALLLPLLGPTHALSVALVARLWWTAGEAGFVGISVLWSSARWRLGREVSDVNP